MNQPLLPCPFCGSDRITVMNIRDGQQAVCKDCHSTGAPTFNGPGGPQATHAEAIARWNTRPLPVEPADGEVEEQWRNLALQFDAHRIEALAMLRGVVAGTASVEHIKSFLAAPPKCAAALRRSSGGVAERPVAWRVRYLPGWEWRFTDIDPERIPQYHGWEHQPLYTNSNRESREAGIGPAEAPPASEASSLSRENSGALSPAGQEREAVVEECAREARDHVDTLTESLQEGLMSDAGLTKSDRYAMRAQLDCLEVVGKEVPAAIRALAKREPSP